MGGTRRQTSRQGGRDTKADVASRWAGHEGRRQVKVGGTRRQTSRQGGRDTKADVASRWAGHEGRRHWSERRTQRFNFRVSTDKAMVCFKESNTNNLDIFNYISNCFG